MLLSLISNDLKLLWNRDWHNPWTWNAIIAMITCMMEGFILDASRVTQC